MDSRVSQRTSPAPTDDGPAVFGRAATNLALTLPAFGLGALAGNGTASGRATWFDLAWLLAPAIVGLIEAVAARIRAKKKQTRARRRAAS